MTATPLSASIPRPAASEYLEYYGKYIEQVPDGDLLTLLQQQKSETAKLLKGITPEQADFAYGPGKWTVKEVVGHLSDAERVFAYRALRFARGDATPLSPFDENLYVPAGQFGRRTIADLADEFASIRSTTVHLAKHLGQDALARQGIASGHPITVRALLYIIAGHERHHVALLRERYLKG